MKGERDSLYAGLLADVEPFAFDERVAAVFADMIRRSVPGYSTVIGMLGVLASKYAARGTRVYDLGCSLGAATAAMRSRLLDSDCTFVAVDNAPAMVSRAREVFDTLPGPPVDVVCADIDEVVIERASIVVLNYTLQFVPLSERLRLLERIHAGLVPGGVLVVSEKIVATNPRTNERLIELHHRFKRAKGYSDLEISQKRSALEDVLLPETLAMHRDRLGAAGFSDVDLWFQCCNFVSLLAYA